MNNIQKFVRRFILPRTSFPALRTLVPPSPPSGNSLMNSFQKYWFSSLLGRASEPRPLLALPPPVSTMQVAGFKVKYALKRRCKDCYFVVRQQRMYVICPTHPRHKQMAPVKKPRYTWILTHGSQSKVRPW